MSNYFTDPSQWPPPVDLDITERWDDFDDEHLLSVPLSELARPVASGDKIVALARRTPPAYIAMVVVEVEGEVAVLDPDETLTPSEGET